MSPAAKSSFLQTVSTTPERKLQQQKQTMENSVLDSNNSSSSNSNSSGSSSCQCKHEVAPLAPCTVPVQEDTFNVVSRELDSVLAGLKQRICKIKGLSLPPVPASVSRQQHTTATATPPHSQLMRFQRVKFRVPPFNPLPHVPRAFVASSESVPPIDEKTAIVIRSSSSSSSSSSDIDSVDNVRVIAPSAILVESAEAPPNVNSECLYDTHALQTTTPTAVRCPVAPVSSHQKPSLRSQCKNLLDFF
jgi:hypothetical protein